MPADLHSVDGKPVKAAACGLRCVAAEISGRAAVLPGKGGGDDSSSSGGGGGGGSSGLPAVRAEGAYGPMPDGSETVPRALKRTSVPGAAPAAGAAFDFTRGGNQWVRAMMRAPASCESEGGRRGGGGVASTLTPPPPLRTLCGAAASGAVTDKAALADGTFSDDVTQARQRGEGRGSLTALRPLPAPPLPRPACRSNSLRRTPWGARAPTPCAARCGTRGRATCPRRGAATSSSRSPGRVRTTGAASA